MKYEDWVKMKDKNRDKKSVIRAKVIKRGTPQAQPPLPLEYHERTSKNIEVANKP